ncbi:MAG: acetyl-CoA carboxylase biotin carboxylase subunit, partial [Planctomycetes bacterium]|nr:acetyl-CoA carboxylase biotin carboxylase subunit [Planctomycetota bacterium]
MKKVLIANRGEIAVRVIRACRERGLLTAAVFSTPDRQALHVQLADEAFHVGPAPAAESYLHVDRLLAAARQAGADAVHPGYGFLSENAAFARRVTEAGLTFIGPSADTIARMGDKTSARALMREAGVPVTPGALIEGLSPPDLLAAAEGLGFPLLVKAAAGGGGKGMRLVRDAAQLAEATAGAASEAAQAFGDGRVYLEKYLSRPRHVEVQVFGDAHGNHVHLFERECSLQRRHQKVVEESPSPALDEPLRDRMCETAVEAARAADYVGAGTVEFLLSPEGTFYFLEMNTRWQVEHPVTEMITGRDLVQWQLGVAAGEELPPQEEITARGHAIECRIYAEDPEKGFLPAVGEVLALEEPESPGVRVDSSLYAGMAVTAHYDPLLAKLIVCAAGREGATTRMLHALSRYTLLGVTSNIDWLAAVLRHGDFAAGDFHTGWIEEKMSRWRGDQNPPGEEELAALAVLASRGEG